MTGSRMRMLLAVVLVVACAGPALAASTARAALGAVTAVAQKWQADAVLTHVSTLRGTAEGKAASWLYTFHSPKAKKSAIVTARGQQVEIEADVRNTSTDALGADFLDSDKAAQAAAKAGLAIPAGSQDVGFGLVIGNQAVGAPQLFWSVTVMGDDGTTSVLLNGKTGAFLRRDEQKF